jgi:predicted metal-dependent phosphoesterase TrpH
MFDYAGAIHIHTEYSYDGNVKMPDVIKAAQKAGLDFIVITDHFRMDAKRDGWEGWHDGLLVIVGSHPATIICWRSELKNR